MKITHLVTNGCSWTYGYNLLDPKTQAWPAVVAKKLNLPLVNLALPGSSNDSILRRTTEYIYQNQLYDSTPLIVIAWSQMTRREGWNKETGMYEEIHIGPGNDINSFNEHQKCHLINYDFRDHCRRNLIYQTSLISIFRSLNIPYCIGYYSHRDIGEWEFSKIGRDTKQKYSNIYNFVHTDTNRWRIALSSLTTSCKKLSCGHEDVAGHNIIADYVSSFITSKHELEIIDSKYLELKDFENLANYSHFAWY